MRKAISIVVAALASCLITASAHAQRAVYGEVFAEDYGAVGYNPPPGVYGAWPNPVMVDSGPAIQRASDAVPFGGTLHFESCRYRSNQTQIIRHELMIEMLGDGMRASQVGCGIWFKADIPGIVINAKATLRGMKLGTFNRPAGQAINPAAHGVVMHFSAVLDGLSLTGFAGNAILIDASTPVANANSWRINGGSTTNCGGWGLQVRGTDANEGVALNFSASTNKLGGINDASFLGNTYISPHTANNLGPSYAIGVEYNSVTGARVEKLTQSSLLLNPYQEDGSPIADLGGHTIWIGGFGANRTSGTNGTVLRWDGSGLSSDHFTAIKNGKEVARVGSSGTGLGDLKHPSAASLFALISPRAGWIDFGFSTAAGQTAFGVSTSSATEGAAQVRFPNGIHIGTAECKIGNGNAAPTTGTWKKCDRITNTLPVVHGTLEWVCLVSGTPGTWFAIPIP